MDDCGDGSDENSCTNHFQCATSGTFVPLTKHCDGKIDCSDLSDECNDQCGKKIIGDYFLKGAGWTIGSLATSLNLIILVHGLWSIHKCKSAVALLNKLLIMSISFGDFLMGSYLLFISAVDAYYGASYCKRHTEWLTSVSCSTLGVISTIGSQTSLFAMTVLSFTRLLGIKNAMSIPTGMSKMSCLITIGTILVILLAAVFIGVSPLLYTFEDFFVNGVKYNSANSLFLGFPNKQKHYEILEQYYGRFNEPSLKWSTINSLVDGMFTDYYGGIGRKSLDFYGNDGVCLFKYFVNEDDPQITFVWVCLLVNFVCFMIIAVSYILINFLTGQSSRKLTDNVNKALKKRNSRVQRKISVIIATGKLLCKVIPMC